MKQLRLLVIVLLPRILHAAPITQGDVTLALGPDFLLDDAATGGGDTNLVTAEFDRDLTGLWIGTAGCDASISGIGWASPAGGTTATLATVTITYLGADGAEGGGDDVGFGSVTDTLNFTGVGEYFWQFDTPLTNRIDDLNELLGEGSDDDRREMRAKVRSALTERSRLHLPLRS